MKDTVVVNIKTGAKYDVYIGRPSKWGNPYSHKPTKYDWVLPADDLEQSLRMYEQYILLLSRWGERDFSELKGKILGCFCKPGPCHGDILVRLANESV